jgi:hypothetical protein
MNAEQIAITITISYASITVLSSPLSSETLTMFLGVLYLVADLQPKASVTHTRTHAHVPAHAEAEAAMAA